MIASERGHAVGKRDGGGGVVGALVHASLGPSLDVVPPEPVGERAGLGQVRRPSERGAAEQAAQLLAEARGPSVGARRGRVAVRRRERPAAPARAWAVRPPIGPTAARLGASVVGAAAAGHRARSAAVGDAALRGVAPGRPPAAGLASRRGGGAATKGPGSMRVGHGRSLSAPGEARGHFWAIAVSAGRSIPDPRLGARWSDGPRLE